MNMVREECNCNEKNPETAVPNVRQRTASPLLVRGLSAAGAGKTLSMLRADNP